MYYIIVVNSGSHRPNHSNTLLGWIEHYLYCIYIYIMSGYTGTVQHTVLTITNIELSTDLYTGYTQACLSVDKCILYYIVTRIQSGGGGGGCDNESLTNNAYKIFRFDIYGIVFTWAQ